MSAVVRQRTEAPAAADELRDAQPEYGSLKGRKVVQSQELDLVEECCTIFANVTAACCWICHACLDIVSE
jgi:hypothetical protein